MAERFVVVFKTYTWDGFVERQAHRLQAAAAGGDFFISIDETTGSFPNIPFANIDRISNAKVVALGLSDRFERGSLLWWNPDYAHYHFFAKYPDYESYVFVEYDVVVQESIADLVARINRVKADFVARPIDLSDGKWFWRDFHLQVYPHEQLRASLNCFSVYSFRAMEMLFRRRREMADQLGLIYWPSSEAFLATEIGRAGFRQAVLDDFGDGSAYDWFPPTLEEDLPQHPTCSFLHPVLDQQRFVAVNLRSNASPLSFLWPRSTLRRRLARVPASAYLKLLPGAFRRRLLELAREQMQLLRARLRGRRSSARTRQAERKPKSDPTPDPKVIDRIIPRGLIRHHAGKVYTVQVHADLVGDQNMRGGRVPGIHRLLHTLAVHVPGRFAIQPIEREDVKPG